MIGHIINKSNSSFKNISITNPLSLLWWKCCLDTNMPFTMYDHFLITYHKGILLEWGLFHQADSQV